MTGELSGSRRVTRNVEHQTSALLDDELSVTMGAVPRR